MKRLNIDRELMWVFVSSFIGNENYAVTTEQKPNGLTIVTFKHTEAKVASKPATLNIYENKDGSTTIDYERGKNIELSKSIAEGIVNYSTTRL